MFFKPVIFLTQTYLDNLLFSQFLAFNFFEKNQDWFASSDFEVEILATSWQNYLVKNSVKLENFSEKKEFVESLMSYQVDYPEPFLLFLGDLKNYSTQLQEGMLRILEEPPKNLQIILFSQNENSLLPTISSRTQKKSLPNDLVYKFLDSSLLEKVKAKMPSVQESVKLLLQDKLPAFEDVAKLEREEIDFWLWQLQKYLEEYFKQKPSSKISQKLAGVSQAQLLQANNIQKKLVLASLNLF